MAGTVRAVDHLKIFDNYIPKDENEENGEEKNEPKEA